MSVILDEEAVILEGLDFEAPCAAPTEHAANVLLRTRCCRTEVLLCGAHLSVIREAFETRVVSKCKSCGHRTFSFDDAAEVVPL